VRCSVLQRIAVCCSALQWNTALQCAAVRCSVVQCVAVRCSALQWNTMWQCVAVRCSALQRVAVKYYVAVRCSVLQCVAVCCSEILSKMTITYSIYTFDLSVFRVIFISNVGMVTFFDSWEFVPCASLRWKYGGVLSDTACCSALQCVAVCCSLVQWDYTGREFVPCISLKVRCWWSVEWYGLWVVFLDLRVSVGLMYVRFSAVCCSVLQCVAGVCSVLQCLPVTSLVWLSCDMCAFL